MDALAEDPGVQRLLRALRLTEGFAFYLVLCPGRDEARALLENLQPLGDPLVLDASPQMPASLAIPDTVLIDQLLKPLVFGEHPEPRLFVIDGSWARPQDEAAWRIFFERLNQRRNIVANQLPGPLMLLLPRSYEVSFAHTAPDLWSIRSLVTILPEPAPQATRGLELLSSSPRPVNAMLLYAPEDARWARRLAMHLAPLVRSGLLQYWSQDRIAAGANVEEAVRAQLAKADLVLALLSPEFLDQEGANDLAQEALAKGTSVVPILLRPVRSRRQRFDEGLSLPRMGEPIASARDPDEALAEVTAEIHKRVTAIRHRSKGRSRSTK